jgi:hypothetical protein
MDIVTALVLGLEAQGFPIATSLQLVSMLAGNSDILSARSTGPIMTTLGAASVAAFQCLVAVSNTRHTAVLL